MALFRMYVDETGNSSVRLTHRPSDKYLSLTGVIMEREYHHAVVRTAFEDLKRKHFDYDPDDPPIFHRQDMKGRRGIFGCLKDNQKNLEFCEDVVGFLKTHHFTLITALIDKGAHRQQHGGHAWEAYKYCFKVLLQRYIMFLGGHHQGDVLIEARGKAEDREVMSQYESFRDLGDYYIPANETRRKLTSRSLKVKTKAANIPGLQVADLVATEIRDEILHEKAGFQEPAGFSKRVCETIRYKHHSNRGGVVWGVGKIWIGPSP